MKKNISTNKKIRAKTLDQYLRERYPSQKKRHQLDERLERLALGYEIYTARKKKRFTQARLAKKLKTTQSVIARIETGEQNVTADTLNEIAKALGKRIKIEIV